MLVCSKTDSIHCLLIVKFYRTTYGMIIVVKFFHSFIHPVVLLQDTLVGVSTGITSGPLGVSFKAIKNLTLMLTLRMEY